MTDRVYIPQLREGSDDCEDVFTWSGPDAAISQALYPYPDIQGRYCAVYTGTADRDVLDSLARGES